MKKQLLVAIAILAILELSNVANAQPVITGAINGPIGSKLFGYVIPGPITPGSAGANQTWDYSSIVYDSSTYYFENIGYAALSQAMKDTFPTGNIASQYVLNGSTVAKLVFRLDANALVYLGLNTTKFATPDTQLVFPHNYLETHEGTFYDAYGTLITPFGTFSDVVRLREISGGKYKYDYYKFDPIEIILMEYLVDTVTQVVSGKIFLDTSATVTGIFDEVQPIENCSIYPNPSNGYISIELAACKNATAEIFNLEGQRLQSILLQSSKTAIKIDHLPNGVYFIKIKSPQGVTVKKLVKD